MPRYKLLTLAMVSLDNIDSLATALAILARAESVQLKHIDTSVNLFTNAKVSTIHISSSYFWVDKDGILLLSEDLRIRH